MKRLSMFAIWATLLVALVVGIPAAADQQTTNTKSNTGTNSDGTPGTWDFYGTATYTLQIDQMTQYRTYDFGSNGAKITLVKSSGYIDAEVYYYLALDIWEDAGGGSWVWYGIAWETHWPMGPLVIPLTQTTQSATAGPGMIGIPGYRRLEYLVHTFKNVAGEGGVVADTNLF